MRVFLLSFDVDDHQYLASELDNDEFERRMRFDGSSRGETWSRVNVHPHNVTRHPPEIWCINSVPILGMSEDTAATYADELSECGEFLEFYIPSREEVIWGFNITRVLDCIEPSAFDLDALELYPEFIESRLPRTGLFRLPQTARSQMYCVEGGGRSAFADRVARGGFRGLQAFEVWSSDDGSHPINLMRR